jgi:hypothetical protein
MLEIVPESPTPVSKTFNSPSYPLLKARSNFANIGEITFNDFSSGIIGEIHLALLIVDQIRRSSLLTAQCLGSKQYLQVQESLLSVDPK